MGSRAGAVVRDGKVRLWSRNGKEFTDKFPDVVGALEAQLRVDCVLDGELVVWTGERLDFDALQRRMVNTSKICPQGVPVRAGITGRVERAPPIITGPVIDLG